MTRQHDWVPHSRHPLYKKVAVTTVPYINGHLTPLGMAKGTTLGDWYANTFLTEAFNPYDAAYVEWSNPKTRTSLTVEQMNGAEKVFIPVYRRLFRLMTGNLLATDPDPEGMGFPKRPDGSRTPAPVATEAPGFDTPSSTPPRLTSSSSTATTGGASSTSPCGGKIRAAKKAPGASCMKRPCRKKARRPLLFF
jgi:hypothetical protein